jgi:hypothetical protein
VDAERRRYQHHRHQREHRDGDEHVCLARGIDHPEDREDRRDQHPDDHAAQALAREYEERRQIEKIDLYALTEAGVGPGHVDLGREQARAQHAEENVLDDEDDLAGIGTRELLVEIAEDRVQGRGGEAVHVP